MRSGTWPSGRKDAVLKLDGVTVEDEIASIVFTEDLNGSEDQVCLGACGSSCVEVTVKQPKSSYENKRLSVEIGGIPLGVFTVTNVKGNGADKVITACDDLTVKLGGLYTPSDPAPTTAIGVLRDICSNAGVELGVTDAAGTAVVDEADVGTATVGGEGDVTDVPISGNLMGYTMREMVGLMAALLGGNARMDRDGKLVVSWYRSSGLTIGPDSWYAGSMSKRESDFSVEKLQCLVVTQETVTETDDSGYTTIVEQENEETLTAGTGATGIAIENPLMTQSVLEQVFRQTAITFRPMEVAVAGDLRIEAGDMVTVTNQSGTSFSVPVMKAVHTWDGHVMTKVTAVGQSETDAETAPDGQVSGQLKSIQADIAEFKNLYAANLTATKAKISNLYADNAWVQELFAQDITATGTIRGVTLEGANGSFSGNVEATSFKYLNEIKYLHDNGDGDIFESVLVYWNQDTHRNHFMGDITFQDLVSFDLPANFDSNITTGGNIGFTSPYSDGTRSIYCKWKDGSNHDLIVRSSDGLSAAVGWKGSPDYDTKLDLRSRTVRLINSSGTSTLSDERMKKDWKPLDSYDAFFDALNPRAFRYVDGSSGRYHLGFGAQSVERALADSGLDNSDFGGLIKYAVPLQSDDWRGYSEEYGLIYTEFVALLTDQVQKMKSRVDELERQNASMEQRMAALEKLIGG